MSETPHATFWPRDAHWRRHLDLAMTKPDHTLVLADMDGEGSMAMQVRTTRPRDLLDMARSLIEQAAERLEEDDSAEAAELAEIADDALAILPDPHTRDENQGAAP